MKRIITALMLFPLLSAGQTKFSQLPTTVPDGYTSFVGLKNVSGTYTDYLFSLSSLAAYLESSSPTGLNNVLTVNPNSNLNINLGVSSGTHPYAQLIAGLNTDGTGMLTVADTTTSNSISLTTAIGAYPQVLMTNASGNTLSLNTNGASYSTPEIYMHDAAGAFTDITTTGGFKTSGKLTMSNVTLQPLITGSTSPTVYLQQQAGTLPVTVAKADIAAINATTTLVTYAAPAIATLQVSCYVTITNYTSGNVQLAVVWTDENGTGQQITSAVETALGRYSITTQPIRVGAGVISIKVLFSTGASLKCDAGGWLMQ